jgi:hypothetical protein
MTEKVCVAITLLACIPELPISNPGRHTSYLGWSSSDKLRDGISYRPRPLHSNSFRILYSLIILLIADYTDCPMRKRSIFWEVIVSALLSKKCICTCVLFRTVSEIQLFHCTVHCTDEILRTVSNTGIYCSSDIVGTASIHFTTRVRTWRLACLYSVQWTYCTVK